MDAESRRLAALAELAAQLEDRQRGFAVCAGLLMILASKSRMGLVGLVGCTIAPRLLPLVVRSMVWLALSGVMASLAIWGAAAIDAGKVGIHSFKTARPDSTRVRETLQPIAWERWQSDAVWFGPGAVQPGPHLVEYMPIDSHHTWYRLLFVKGLTGFLALLVPLVAHLCIVIAASVHHASGRLPLGNLMTMVLLSFGENIEIEAYMLLPALVILGSHLREISQ